MKMSLKYCDSNESGYNFTVLGLIIKFLHQIIIFIQFVA